MTDDALSEMLVNRILVLFSVCVCLFACLLSVSPDKRPAGPAPSDLHPSTVLPPARQT